MIQWTSIEPQKINDNKAAISCTIYIKEISYFRKISFIKIDVEGHELAVIKGAENTIRKNKPILLVEIEERHSQKKVSDTLNYINSLGYISYFYKNELLKTSSLDNLNLYNNFIFKPK